MSFLHKLFTDNKDQEKQTLLSEHQKELTDIKADSIKSELITPLIELLHSSNTNTPLHLKSVVNSLNSLLKLNVEGDHYVDLGGVSLKLTFTSSKIDNISFINTNEK